MTKEEKRDQLFNTPRMGHVPLDDNNSVKGLYQLVEKHFKPEFKIAEIGSFMGVSTMLFSLYVDIVYSIDCYDYPVPPTGRIPSHDQLFVDAERIFLERTSDIPNIIKIRKTSLEAFVDFEERSLDAVYIDAEHDYNSVLSDIRVWKDKIKIGGILCGHDYTLPYIQTILLNENLINGLETYPDSSWSVIIE